MGRLSGKTAIITGTNRGIGKEILISFAREGADIWACARQESDEFTKFICEIEKENEVSIRPVYFDLADENQVKTAIKSIIQEKKKIDILVNNAGIAYGATFQMTSIEKMKEVFEVNFFSQIYIMQLVSRHMMKQKSGSIINMASVGGIETNPGYLAYGSSKAALIWATKCLSKEIGIYGVHVNAIAPGLTETSMGHYKSEEELQKVINRTSLRRMGTPNEIAEAVLYLASDDASFITGQVLQVDGGRG